MMIRMLKSPHDSFLRSFLSATDRAVAVAGEEVSLFRRRAVGTLEALCRKILCTAEYRRKMHVDYLTVLQSIDYFQPSDNVACSFRDHGTAGTIELLDCGLTVNELQTGGSTGWLEENKRCKDLELPRGPTNYAEKFLEGTEDLEDFLERNEIYSDQDLDRRVEQWLEADRRVNGERRAMILQGRPLNVNGRFDSNQKSLPFGPNELGRMVHEACNRCSRCSLHWTGDALYLVAIWWSQNLQQHAVDIFGPLAETGKAAGHATVHTPSSSKAPRPATSTPSTDKIVSKRRRGDFGPNDKGPGNGSAPAAGGHADGGAKRQKVKTGSRVVDEDRKT
eukprot:g3093.t1